MKGNATIAALALAAALVSSAGAIAGPIVGYVTADSRFGHGTVSGPVRQAQYGLQVRPPGGSWIYCENKSLLFDRHRPCSETLRRESLDFWETMMDDRGGR